MRAGRDRDLPGAADFLWQLVRRLEEMVGPVNIPVAAAGSAAENSTSSSKLALEALARLAEVRIMVRAGPGGANRDRRAESLIWGGDEQLGGQFATHAYIRLDLCLT